MALKIVITFSHKIHCPQADRIIDACQKFIIPGVIDPQVHFREPGLTHKEDIKSGARAAVCGGITTFFEMPNTNPATINSKFLEEKFIKYLKSSKLKNIETSYELLNLNIKNDIRIDIYDSKKIAEIISKIKPDYIFHLAAQPLVALSYQNEL